jgi:chloramphenicol 3-O-phosphotransferase
MAIVVLLNGPPGSGKDTLANALCDAYPGVVHMQFKEALYDLVQSHYAISRDMIIDRKTKDTPLPAFNNMTPRDMMIHVAEHVIKVQFGPAYFAQTLARRLEFGTIAVVSDCGFDVEVETLSNVCDVVLVRLTRPGCTYQGDSRTELPSPHVIIENNLSEEEFKASATRVLLKEIERVVDDM